MSGNKSIKIKPSKLCKVSSILYSNHRLIFKILQKLKFNLKTCDNPRSLKKKVREKLQTLVKTLIRFDRAENLNEIS